MIEYNIRGWGFITYLRSRFRIRFISIALILPRMHIVLVHINSENHCFNIYLQHGYLLHDVMI